MNRFGSNSYDNENDQFAQNQQIGRQLGENSPRPWNEQSRYHGIPDNRHGSRPNYRPDPVNDIRYVNRNELRNEWGGRGGESPVNPYYPADTGYRHHDTNIWTERNDYKDADYRYRSGHRGYWHEDYDQKYEGRPLQHRHPRDFFSNLGQGIREGWHNLTHRDQEDENRWDKDNRREDKYGRKQPYNPYESYRLDNSHSRTNPQSNEWHNSGPDHRDEDFFDSRNFRP